MGKETEKSKPEILRRGGRPLFAVLPYAEYRRMREAIRDLYDRLSIAEAEREDRGKPHRTLEQVMARIAARKKKAGRGNGRKAKAKAR